MGVGMKDTSHNLVVHWKTIHELTNLPKTHTQNLDNNIIEIFEPRPYETAIQPRLVNWRDLEIPKQ